MDFFAYLVYRFLTGLLAALPLPAVFCAGKFLGAVAYCLAVKYRRLVIRNLSVAFGDEKSADEIRNIARAHFTNLGANLLSSVKLASMSVEAVHARARWENPEYFASLIEKGNIIGMLSHIGNWELMAQIPTWFPAHPFSTVYQQLKNKWIDADIRKSRARYGVEPFERKDGFKAPVKFMREGGSLAILVDQHAGDAGIWAPIFNRLASTSPLAATLAIRTGAPIVPVAVYTDGLARWKLVADKPIPTDDTTIETLTAEINQALERQVRSHPQDWFWVHDRWKTPKPRLLLSNYKRGVHYPLNYDPAKLKPFRFLIRSSNWLGDAVMSAPAVRAIKRGRPDAHITVLTRAKLADFWKLVPEVDAVIPIGESDNIFRVAKKIGSGFDAAVVFPNSVRSALEPWLAHVPRRIGFDAKWRNPLLNQIPRKGKKAHPPEHQSHHYMRLAQSMGADTGDFFPVDFQSPVPKKERPATGTPLRIGLCPGADYGPAKRWLPERFAEVMRTVSRQRKCEWILFGTEKDQPVGAEILGHTAAIPVAETGDAQANEPVNCTNLIGKTTLAELIDELARCQVLLTNDSGSMHLAAFLGVPTVSIFGSTEPVLTGPLGKGHQVLRHHVACSPCFLRECPLDFRCMKAVGTDEAVEAVLRALAE